MTVLYAAILGILEGITEFLPVSSTGHLILAQKIMGIPQVEFTKTFTMTIQLGAILAVVGIYFSTVCKKKYLWLPIVISFAPTALFGFIFYKPIKHLLLGNDSITAIMLFLGGIALLIIEKYNTPIPQSQNMHITIKQAITIGIAQLFSFIPGVSRSAATISGGMLTGLSRTNAVEFSFLLSIPTLSAAALYDLYKTPFVFSNHEYFILAIGFIFAFISALVAMRMFLAYVKTHSFVLFSWYRIAVAILYWVFII